MTKIPSAKLLLLTFVAHIVSLQVNAKKVDSYIITNNHDTVYGSIRLSRFNLFHNTISLNSYHIEDLFDHIFFKSESDKKFKELLPMDILEYGFVLGSTKYRYISKEIKPGWGRNKRKFYLQLTDGVIDVFKVSSFLDNRGKNLNPYGTRITEYYILSKDNSLVSVFENDRGDSVSGFLMKYLDLDKALLEKVTKDKTFKDIREIALQYNKQVNCSN